MGANDILTNHLIELAEVLKQKNIPIILGGGMSLYLRTIYLKNVQNKRYPFNIEPRSTNDLDIFLASDLIVDFDRMSVLRDTLIAIGYNVVPEAKNFQFCREIEISNHKRTVKIDLLCAPPDENKRKFVEYKKPRMKPKNIEGIHVYCTDEARGIGIGLKEIIIANDLKIFIPSAYNYLILKLHAFNDRKDKKDDKSDFGRHHAFDIFMTIIQMDEHDWDNAAQHLKLHSNEDYLRKAITIVTDSFNNQSAIGVLRLKENRNYQEQKEIYNLYIGDFIKDLKDLFIK